MNNWIIKKNSNIIPLSHCVYNALIILYLLEQDTMIIYMLSGERLRTHWKILIWKEIKNSLMGMNASQCGIHKPIKHGGATAPRHIYYTSASIDISMHQIIRLCIV